MSPSTGRTSTLDIRTPEGVTFSLPLAGPVSRGAAWMIDFAVILGLYIGASKLSALVSIVGGDWGMAVRMLLMLAISLGYGFVSEWFMRGQTIGKKVMKLRVMDERGLTLTLGQVAVRNVMRTVDALPLLYAVGGISMVLTRHSQRLGDLAAGTVVVRLRETKEPRLESILAGQYNSFRDHPLQEARLRQRTSPEEARLCLSALLRRDTLEPGHRLRLYGELASHYRESVEFPAEVTIGLTDEQFLRNVVETLFRKRSV